MPSINVIPPVQYETPTIGSDRDKSIWDALQVLAEAIEDKYHCSECKYAKYCVSGKNCYIDYLDSMRQNGRTIPKTIPRRYKYIEEDLKNKVLNI